MQTLSLRKTYRKYPEYKDSGVEWLNRIPEEWKTLSPKRLFKEIIQKGDVNLPLASVTQDQGVVLRSESGLTVWNPQSGTLGYKVVCEGDFVISLRSFEGGIEYSGVTGLVSPAYVVLRNIKPIASNYFKWLLKSKAFLSMLQINTRGIRQGKNITYQDFSTIDLPIPQDQEQVKIGNFLDGKVDFIDKIIVKKQKLVELLKEKRTAIINQAVTKGLDPKAELVESGIDWIGKIPIGWKIVRIKHIAKLLSGFAFASESYLDEGLPIIRITDVKSEINIDELPKVSPSHKQILSDYRTQKNDTLIAMTGATIGKSCFINSDNEMYVNQRVSIVRSNKQFARYIFSSINADGFKKYIDFLSNGGAQQNISNYDIGNFRIAFPSNVIESNAIIEALEIKADQFSKALKGVERSIENLVEFKLALISNVVTGKDKV